MKIPPTSKPPTAAQREARKRNWAIRRVRGVYANLYSLVSCTHLLPIERERLSLLAKELDRQLIKKFDKDRKRHGKHCYCAACLATNQELT